MANHTAWYRLENIGTLYAAEAGGQVQTVFRYSAELTEPVDPNVLQEATDATIDMFPHFNAVLRTGIFWHYLEESSRPIAVEQESAPICHPLHTGAGSQLVRVSFYRQRINFEVSHIVSDGRGSLMFFQELLRSYIERAHHVEGVERAYDGSDEQKAEDSFSKYFERTTGKRPREPKAYQLPGPRFQDDPTYLELHLPAKEVVALAKSLGVTVTSLIIATVIESVAQEMPVRERNKPVRVGVPVDLRQAFSSSTTRNFFGLTIVGTAPGQPVRDLEDIARDIDAQLREAVTLESLKARMNYMVALEKSKASRPIPVVLKDLVMRLGQHISLRDVTTTVSNLGVVRLDPRLAPYVRNVNILTSTVGLNFTVCSWGDDLSVGISTVHANPNVAKNFVRAFTGRGMAAYINSSRARDLLPERNEAPVPTNPLDVAALDNNEPLPPAAPISAADKDALGKVAATGDAEEEANGR